MHRWWVRLTLVIITLVVTVGLSFYVLQIEEQQRLARQRAAEYQNSAWSLTVALADLRAARQAYVASGQDLDTSLGRATSAVNSVSGALDLLEAQSVTVGAADALQNARTTLERWNRIDSLAREYATDERTLMASDLAFTDGPDLAARAAAHLTAARQVEDEAYAFQLRERRDTQLTAGLSAVALSLVAVSLLLPIGRRRSPDQEDSVRRSVPKPPAPESHETATPAERGRQATPDNTNLAALADVCTDLGRLTDSAGLDDMLGRICRLLDARGLVLWMQDGDDPALRPAAAHGYATGGLDRMGRVEKDADNVTAIAFRTERLQVISGDSNEPGGVAVPLLRASAPGRCAGVLALELPPGKETVAAVQSTAAIVAAQLATLVDTEPAPASVETAAPDTVEDEGDTDTTVEAQAVSV